MRGRDFRSARASVGLVRSAAGGRNDASKTSPAFIIDGAAPPPDKALVSGGSELRLRNGWSVIGKFDGEFASRLQSYAGTGTVRYVW